MVNELEEKQEYYSDKVREAEQNRYDLEINGDKFARERYYMQKRDEDVFIIKDPEELK